MRSQLGSGALALFVSLLAPPGACADEAGHSDGGASAEVVEAEAADAFHRNHIAILVGGTLEFEEHETLGGVTVGLDYERRLLRWLGVGGFVEYVSPEVDAFLAGGAVTVHPWRELKLSVGGGWEHRFHEGEGYGLLRFGGAYDFEVRGTTIAPTVDVDVLRRNVALVFGVAIGWGF